MRSINYSSARDLSPNHSSNADQETQSVSQTFDPSKFLSDDFLAILKEHRKTCEREGKMDEAN